MQEFKIVTDHASLKWLMSQKDLSGRLARWSLKLQRFSFEIEHRKGSQHVVPDALSRVHCADEIVFGDTNGANSFDVLHVDLSDPSFKSDEYVRLIETVEKNKSQLPDLQVTEGFVYKKVKFSTGNPIEDDQTWKLWIPSALTSHLVHLAHDPPKASHGGVAKTLYRLRERFYWPNMAVQVKLFIADCSVCKSSKAPNSTTRPPMGQAFVVERPFQHVFVDFLGPYPRSKQGNVYMIICLDQLTKFVVIQPLRKATSESAMKFLEEHVFSIFGVPESLLSDNGKQFTSKDFSKLLATYGIRHVRTASYSPQANASERVNRSILTAIRSYIAKEPNQTNWDKHIPSIASALRTTTHAAIRMSPHEALFGQSKVEHGHDYALLKKLKGLNYSEIDILPKSCKMNLIHKHLKDSLQSAHNTYEKSYNLRSKDKKFTVGQKVFKRNFILSDKAKKRNAKLCPKFTPAVVKSIPSDNLYELTDSKGNLLGVFHGKDIRV